MIAALELTQRQVARVIREAIHNRARLEIETRIAENVTPLCGQITGQTGNRLRVQLEPSDVEISPDRWIGAFCDVRMTLSGALYLLTSCVLDVRSETGQAVLELATPANIQLCNRRRFERTSATIASRVYLWPAGAESPHLGLLHNIGPHGLACRFPGTQLDEHLLLGDPVRVGFELPGFDEAFELPATVCNKSARQQRNELLVGLEFTPADDDVVGQHTLARLQACLVELVSQQNSETDEPPCDHDAS